MKKFLALTLCMLVLALSSLPVCFAAADTAQPTTIDDKQVILLKLDDIREGAAVRSAFKRIKEFIDEKGIKASFGVIGISLEDDGKKEDYYEDIKSFAADGNIEIWHHGYYHDRANHVEFSGGTYEEQYKQLKDTIDLMQKKCNITLRTFGPPYNATDEVTLEVLNDLPQIKTFFFPSVTEGGSQLMLKDGGPLEVDTGVVDYDKFVDFYESTGKNNPYLVLQGHPGGFSEQSYENFTKVVEYLMEQNTVFMTPIEYYNRLNGLASIFPENATYNKSKAPGDFEISINISPYDKAANALCDGIEIGLDADYVTDGDKILLKESYLMSLDNTVHEFEFQLISESGEYSSVYLTLSVIDPGSEPIKVIIDDEAMTFDADPFVVNDRTMVPFRAIFEKFGAQVTWDEENSIAGGILDEIEINLPINSETAYINGVPVELDAAATVMNDRTFVPLRFIAENFGAQVKWYEETRTAKITSAPRSTALTDGAFCGSGLAPVSVKSVLNDYKQELFTLDGEIVPDNRWAAEGKGVWIQYDLGTLCSVDSAAIAWYKGGERKSNFEIAVSENGYSYTTVFSGESGGETDQLETYTFEPANARYVRIICNGNDSAASASWNSLLEVELYGKANN